MQCFLNSQLIWTEFIILETLLIQDPRRPHQHRLQGWSCPSWGKGCRSLQHWSLWQQQNDSHPSCLRPIKKDRLNELKMFFFLMHLLFPVLSMIFCLCWGLSSKLTVYNMLYILYVILILLQYCYIIHYFCHILFIYTTIQRIGVRKIFL